MRDVNNYLKKLIEKENKFLGVSGVKRVVHEMNIFLCKFDIIDKQ